ncbi:hypothetical protein [Halorientalis pallida]|uniref:Gamma-glutamyl:cysteine ligase YbdK, ATP-grasp superfamily n=1 Tax=Halorientalis pallida TaxID=2479928 RepID=A0A498L2F8_9EURY|nr:hypothetical protein [Halorientalis pallida]RXK50326.1 hypothetical protein EAF64_07120 [Halorientalis pallida]
MSGSELAAQVREALTVDAEAFQTRAEREAEELIEEVYDGTFDNSQAIIGLEQELYAVDDRTDALMRVPRQLLDRIGFEKELGLHNAEIQTTPVPLSRYGLEEQEAELQAHVDAAQQAVGRENIRLVSDGMWTVPPNGETATSYLCDSIEAEGIRIATNMSDAVRYHTMANTDYPSGLRIDAPHVTLEADTVMPESLITSIQPHYQVPHAPDLPEHFTYALRVAGPLAALGANSPFFPPEMYDDVPAGQILADAWMEHRITVFEDVLNPQTGDGDPKVCFPPDFDTVEDAIHDIAGDRTIVPMDVPDGQRFDDRFRHFRHKHGSYWRWVRPVFDGGSRTAANARIEFRPLSGQPTIRDAVAFQALFAGLMESLPRREHPVQNLDWQTAKANFYAAVCDGLQAEFTWLTADASETDAIDEIYGEIFEYARDGLELRGLSTEEARRYIRPLRERVDRRTTPARWKHGLVERQVERGVPLTEAIWGMQARYVEKQTQTLVEGTFADWLDD